MRKGNNHTILVQAMPVEHLTVKTVRSLPLCNNIANFRLKRALQHRISLIDHTAPKPIGSCVTSVTAFQDLAEVYWFTGIFFSKFLTLCKSERRNAGFIPPQRQHIQEHRNISNAFAIITLRRHECRAPVALECALRPCT